MEQRLHRWRRRCAVHPSDTGNAHRVIHDEAFAALREGLESVRGQLDVLIGNLKRAEEERASERTLKSIQRAFREALLALPAEEYDWFEVHRSAPGRRSEASTGPVLDPSKPQHEVAAGDLPDPDEESAPTQAFFKIAGPLHSVRISPASSVVKVGSNRTLRAVCRDRAGRQVDEGVVFAWTIVEGGGSLADPHAEIGEFEAPQEPGLVTVKLVTTQRDVVCEAKALVTVTDSLVASRDGAARAAGTAGLHIRERAGPVVAFALRDRPRTDRHQQRSSGLRFCFPVPGFAVALHRAGYSSRNS